jgi:intergrase/recombinase
MNMHFCRKIHGSWLHQYGRITAEQIDFLQGRTSPSIFSRHYLTPDSSLKTRVLDAVGKLENEIEERK